MTGSCLWHDNHDIENPGAYRTLVPAGHGDNYRAAATCLSQLLDIHAPNPQQVDQATADALSVTTNGAGKFVPNGGNSGYKVPVVWSTMLTVWRKLYVERDTMAAPDTVNLRVVGTIVGIFPTPARPGLTTVKFLEALNPDLNNYEEGTMAFSNCASGSDTFPVVESYPGGMKLANQVFILGTPGACAAVGTGFTLWDDDDLAALGSSMSPRFPDGGNLLQEAFEPAYILPVYADAQYQDVLPFEAYLNYWEILTGEGTWNDGADLDSEPSFWSCLVVGAWEGSSDRFELFPNGDGDPDFCFNLLNPPTARPGAETELTGVRRPLTTQCIVFFQGIADDEGCTFQTDENHTVVHEIAHTSSVLPHKAATIMNEGAPSNLDTFDAEQLKALRVQEQW